MQYKVIISIGSIAGLLLGVWLVLSYGNILGPLFIASIVAAVIIGLLGLAGYIWVTLRNKYLAGERLILTPTSEGNYPVLTTSRGYTLRPEAGNIMQPVPSSIHYSIKNDVQGTMTEPNKLLTELTGGVPTFAQLLEQGKLGNGKNIYLGYDTEKGEMIPGSWNNLYSVALAGVAGSGKTTTVRFLAAQSALAGAKFAIVDPHGAVGENAEGKDESLAGSLAPLSECFLFAPAVDEPQILMAIKLVAGELERRKAGGKREYQLVFCVDELSALMRREKIAPHLQKLLLDIAQEGRKYGVVAMAMAQAWRGDGIGTEIRDSFTSNYVHRMKINQARLMLGSALCNEFNVPELPTGRALLYKTDGTAMGVAIPNCTSADMEAVAGYISGRFPGDNSGKMLLSDGQDYAEDRPEIGQKETLENVADMALQTGKSLSAETTQVKQLFLAGKDVAAITQELRGVNSKQGAKYQQARTEIESMLRRAIA
jgi:hypothetical protein